MFVSSKKSYDFNTRSSAVHTQRVRAIRVCVCVCCGYIAPRKHRSCTEIICWSPLNSNYMCSKFEHTCKQRKNSISRFAQRLTNCLFRCCCCCCCVSVVDSSYHMPRVEYSCILSFSSSSASILRRSLLAGRLAKYEHSAIAIAFGAETYTIAHRIAHSLPSTFVVSVCVFLFFSLFYELLISAAFFIYLSWIVYINACQCELFVSISSQCIAVLVLKCCWFLSITCECWMKKIEVIFNWMCVKTQCGAVNKQSKIILDVRQTNKPAKEKDRKRERRATTGVCSNAYSTIQLNKNYSR